MGDGKKQGATLVTFFNLNQYSLAQKAGRGDHVFWIVTTNWLMTQHVSGSWERLVKYSMMSLI